MAIAFLDHDRRFRTGRLIGWNLGRGTRYAKPNDDRHPEWRTTERIAAVRALGEVRAPGVRPWMRFSGLQIDGSFGNDGYHFDAVPDDNLTPAQYLALMAEADAEPIVTLNFATGTAEEAARYAARVKAEAGGVTQFEIGNECYGIWNTGYSADNERAYAHPSSPDTAWRGRPSSSASDYAARALEYVDRVTRVVPQARFFVPLSQASMDAWGGVEVAAEAFAELFAHGAVNGAVVHQYHVDEAMMFGLDDKNDEAFILAGSERYRAEYERLRAAIEVPIAVTEYHVAGAFARGAFEHGSSGLLGLGIADMLIGYAQLGIEHACQHMSLDFSRADDLDRDILVEPWYVPFFADGAPRSSFVVTKLIAQHLRRFTVPVRMEDERAVLRIGGFEHPLRHAIAFASDKDVTIVVLNRGDESELRIDGYEIDSAICFAPKQPLAPNCRTPPKAIGGGRTVTLPRHSVTAAKLRR